MEEADFIYVDDYCYYIWWLAVVHTYDIEAKQLLKPANALFTVICLTACCFLLDQPESAKAHKQVLLQ